MNVFEVEGYVRLLIALAMLAVAIFAFVNSLLYPAEAYDAAGKLTKTAWCVILGLGVVLQLVPLAFILNLALLIAALVYLVDVRPALAGLRRR